jgi:hypothetical protein
MYVWSSAIARLVESHVRDCGRRAIPVSKERGERDERSDAGRARDDPDRLIAEYREAHDECVLVRALVVVVVTRRVRVVVREVVVAAVGTGVAAAIVDEVVVDAVGLSGAASFCRCVAANALMLARDVSLAAVAMARRSTLERMSGPRCGTSDRTTRPRARDLRAA